jgi:hypothetical protein
MRAGLDIWGVRQTHVAYDFLLRLGWQVKEG